MHEFDPYKMLKDTQRQTFEAAKATRITAEHISQLKKTQDQIIEAVNQQYEMIQILNQRLQELEQNVKEK